LITESQRKDRKQHLGSSDIATLYNVNPYKSAYSVWCEKIYDMKDTDPSEAMNTGIELETPVVNWISKKLKLEIDTSPENLCYTYEKDSLFQCNVDANVLNYPTIIEAKYAGSDKDWNEADSGKENDIPAMYYIQVLHQLMCCNLDYAIVAVWLSGFAGFEKRFYYIKRDEERIKKLAKIGRLWWNKYVIPALDCEHPEKYIPPTKQPLKSLEIFKRIERVSGKINKVDSKTYLAWTDAKRALSKAKKEKDAAEEAFKKQFGDARSAEIIGGGGQIFTFKEERGSQRLDYNILKIKYPQIYKEMVTQGTRQTLREVKV